MSARINDDFSFDEEIDRTNTPALKYLHVESAEEMFVASVADMDFKVPPVVLEVLKKRIEHGIFGYESVPTDLLPALVDWQSTRHGWWIEEQSVLRAPNVSNTLATAASLFTNPGDGILIQPPVFADFYAILEANKLHVVENPLRFTNGRYMIDFEHFEEKASMDTTKIFFLCNPQNPIGRIWTAEELRRLGDICVRHGVLVVSDEMHGDIALPGHKYTPFGSLGPQYADSSIICLSPGKVFNIASCCSSFAVIANETMRNRVKSENNRLSVNKNNALANEAMIAAYRHGATWLDSVMSYLAENIELFKRHLEGISGVSIVEPEGTFLLWVDFRGLQMNTSELNRFLREEAKWIVNIGGSYGKPGDGFVRVNIACPRARLNSALERLREAVSRFKKPREEL